MKYQWFHILLAAAEGDVHGQDIIRRTLDASDGRVKLWPVTLYASIDELLAKNWLRELVGDLHPKGESHRRRYFRITAEGRRALASEAQRLRALSKRAIEATKQ